MTEPTPFRAAILRCLDHLDMHANQQLAEGAPEERVTALRTLVRATLNAYADFYEANDDANEMFATMAVSFGNAIATFIDTFAANVEVDAGLVGHVFIERLSEATWDILRSPPDAVVDVEDRDEVGAAS